MMLKESISTILSHPYFAPSLTILGTLTAIAGVYFGVAFNLGWPPFSTSPPRADVNTEILLDRSAAMLEPFDGETKLTAAIDAIERRLEFFPDSHNLAFRQFAGPCEDGNRDMTRPQVPFGLGKDNKGQVREELKKLRSEEITGETTLVAGITQGVGDFSDPDHPDRFESSTKSIIALIGAEDCRFPDNYPDIIFNLGTDSGIKMNLHMIGVGLKPGVERKLSRVSGITGWTFQNATNKEELIESLETASELASGEKPVIGTLRLVLQADLSQVEVGQQESVMANVITNLNERVNAFGITQAEIQHQGDDQILMRLSEVQAVDIGELKLLVSEIARLEFRERKCLPPPADCSMPGGYQEPDKATGLTGEDLVRATPDIDSQTNGHMVVVNFNQRGSSILEDVTSRLASTNDWLGVFLDDNELFVAPVENTISFGTAIMINPNFTADSVRRIAIALEAGKLPVSLTTIDTQFD